MNNSNFHNLAFLTCKVRAAEPGMCQVILDLGCSYDRLSFLIRLRTTDGEIYRFGSGFGYLGMFGMQISFVKSCTICTG